MNSLKKLGALAFSSMHCFVKEKVKREKTT